MRRCGKVAAIAAGAVCSAAVVGVLPCAPLLAPYDVSVSDPSFAQFQAVSSNAEVTNAASADQGSGADTATSDPVDSSDGADAEGSTSNLVAVEQLVDARDDAGERIALEDVDESSYNGFVFTLKDSAQPARTSNAVSYSELGDMYTAGSLEDVASAVSADCIEAVEPNYKVTATSYSATPDDTHYSEQYNLAMTKASAAWESGLYGQNMDSASSDDVVVAVIDTGLAGTGRMDVQHEDIDYSHVLTGLNLVSNRRGEETSTGDSNGHGTASVGVIAANQNNGKGIAGIAPGAYIYPIKVFGNGMTTDESIVIEAIYAAIKADVDVINLSLGATGSTYLLEEACQAAVDAGIIVIAASGNSADSDNAAEYPAAYDCVISVASVTEDGIASNFSTHNDGVDVAAPGENVWSTHIDPREKYVQESGTSIAAPQVSAFAALVRSVDSKMTQEQFRALLKWTSNDKGTAGYDEYYGWGVVDFQNVMSYLSNEADYKAAAVAGYSVSAPGAVKSASAASVSYKAVKVKWKKAQGASGYHIYRKKTGGNYALVKTASSASIVSWKDTGLKCGTKYKYKVVPYRSVLFPDGTHAKTGTAATTSAKPVPAKAKIKKVKAGKKTVKVTWKKVAGATKYRVYRATKKNGAYKLVKTLGSSKRSWTNKKLKSGKRYYYKVRAYKKASGKKVYGAYSSAKSAKAK